MEDLMDIEELQVNNSDSSDEEVSGSESAGASEEQEESGGVSEQEQEEPVTVVEVTADFTETNEILIGGLFCMGLIFGAILMSLFWSRFRRF